MSEESIVDDDGEMTAIQVVFRALKGLDEAARTRVLNYVRERLAIDMGQVREPGVGRASATSPKHDLPEEPANEQRALEGETSDGLEGVSSVARKWLKRSGLHPLSLEPIFSLGGEEIEVIAESVPGESKRQKLRNVLLLSGIASYLSSGAARVSDEKLRETAGHYDAYDQPNFATSMKGFSSIASGTKESGYTLGPRGLAAATELLKEMVAKR